MNELQHHGVKGMKWGVRKKRGADKSKQSHESYQRGKTFAKKLNKGLIKQVEKSRPSKNGNGDDYDYYYDYYDSATGKKMSKSSVKDYTYYGRKQCDRVIATIGSLTVASLAGAVTLGTLLNKGVIK